VVAGALIIRDIGVPLRGARDFVSVAAIVCDATRVRSIPRCTVTLLGSDGTPILAVDNASELSDLERIACLMEHSIEGPLLRELQEHHAPVERAPHGSR